MIQMPPKLRWRSARGLTSHHHIMLTKNWAITSALPAMIPCRRVPNTINSAINSIHSQPRTPPSNTPTMARARPRTNGISGSRVAASTKGAMVV